MTGSTDPKTETEAEEWFRVMKERGHLPMLNEDGELDEWVLDAGYHNGPGCETCHQSWCQHCTCPNEIEACSNPCLDEVVDYPKKAIAGG